jgi:uncharacterized protein (DUF2147 family)
MRRISLILLMFAALAGVSPAGAADPAGEWRVEDGEAHVRMALCDGRLWGIVSFERHAGTDAKNPDPALRTRPTLGLPVVLGMTPVKPNRWEGSIYNAENGKTYRGSVTLDGADRLEVEGCVWGGWVCDSETWTRVKPEPWSVGSAPGVDICVRLGPGSGRPHEGGLK